MKCEKCGREFHCEPVIETHEITEGIIGKCKAYIRNTTTAPLTLCPECAASRSKIPAFMVSVFIIAVGTVALLRLLLKW